MQQPITLRDGAVTLPITPGRQEATIRWREARGIKSYFEIPPLNVGLAGVNGHLQLELPRDRWILMAGGPMMGPAVLFWGALLAWIVAAYFLGRIS